MHKIALYGANGHQIHNELKCNPRAELHAYAGIALEKDFPAAKKYVSLDELLADGEVEMVSLCSPLRSNQADDAVKVLNAGKHVLAEKPVAMSERDLDRILAAAEESGRKFHSLCATAYVQPYTAIRRELRSGVVGTVEQVHIRKSYPWFDGRPLKPEIDGGLLLWVGIHAARIAEHVTGMKLRKGACSGVKHDIAPGNIKDSAALAVSVLAELENGAPVTMDINLLNCRGTGVWGYEELQIFGREGILETLSGGNVCRRIRFDEKEWREVEKVENDMSSLEWFLDELDGGKFFLTQDEEFSSDRFLLGILKR